MRTSLVLAAALLLGSAAGAADAPRVKAARPKHEAEIRALFEKAKLEAPAGALLLRVFKEEDRIELWAGPSAGAPLTLLKSYEVCARSGGPGPKRRARDGQVPEGVYSISRLNPYSSYHLSLQIDYPNAADRARARKAAVRDPGGDIFIHGECVTIGCLPITNGPIEELYLIVEAAKARGAPVAVHLFPARPGTVTWTQLLARAGAGLRGFWESLEPVYAAFEASHVAPRVQATADGNYRLQR